MLFYFIYKKKKKRKRIKKCPKKRVNHLRALQKGVGHGNRWFMFFICLSVFRSLFETLISLPNFVGNQTIFHHSHPFFAHDFSLFYNLHFRIDSSSLSLFAFPPFPSTPLIFLPLLLCYGLISSCRGPPTEISSTHVH